MMNFIRPRSILILLFIVALYSCSTSQKTTSDNFKAEDYFNPYARNSVTSKPVNCDSSTRFSTFNFAQIKGGYQALHEAVQVSAGARVRNIKGRLLPEIYINQNGKVQQVLVIESPKESFNKSIKTAIKRTDFEPGMCNGEPVKSILRVPIHFVR